MIRVLICDDDPDILEVTTLALKIEKWDIQKLSHLGDIVNVVKEKKPDIILLDLSMPDVCGDEAIELLRDDEGTSDIPVILFSASKNLPNIANGLQVPYIQKPFNIGALRDMMNI